MILGRIKSTTGTIFIEGLKYFQSPFSSTRHQLPKAPFRSLPASYCKRYIERHSQSSTVTWTLVDCNIIDLSSAFIQYFFPIIFISFGFCICRLLYKRKVVSKTCIKLVETDLGEDLEQKSSLRSVFMAFPTREVWYQNPRNKAMIEPIHVVPFQRRVGIFRLLTHCTNLLLKEKLSSE